MLIINFVLNDLLSNLKTIGIFGILEIVALVYFRVFESIFMIFTSECTTVGFTML